MVSRREVLSVLGTAGIGTLTFQRALAAQVGDEPVTARMVSQAEWIAGITLTDQQREAAVNSLKFHREGLARFRAVKLDPTVSSGFRFVPYASADAQPDPRSYDRSKVTPVVKTSVSKPESDEDLAFASIRTLGTLLRGQKISSVELTKLYLQRLQRYDPLLKCIVTLTEETAFQQAEKADRELRQKMDRGPLHGIPYGLKDIFSYPGYPTTWCVPEHRERIIDEKAAVAERLEQAGAVLIAKLANNPYAGGSEIWYRGLTRNPWNPKQGASGSSSGSGSATAAGLVGFSIASETAGSIIHPSMTCGVTGLRPTYGRVSRYGCMPLCWSLDKVGTICRTADDCALVFATIHGADDRDLSTVNRDYLWPSPRDLSSIRVGYEVQKGEPTDRTDMETLERLGVTLVPIPDTPPLADYGLTYELIYLAVTIESSVTFEELVKAGGPKGIIGWPRYLVFGHLLTAVDYAKLIRMRSILMERIDRIMRKIDVYVGSGLSAYSSLTGHPCMIVPYGIEEKEDKLVPRTQMLTGRIYDESTLLTLADAFQRSGDISRRPPLEKFLAEKDSFLAGEEYPDLEKYYPE